MKVIFYIVLLTVVYVVGMTKFSDNQEYLNASRLAALEHQYNMSFSFGNDFFENIEEDDNDEFLLSVFFSGAVNSTKEIKISYGSTLEVAINKAGGLLPDADKEAINLFYVIEKDCSFYIPKIGDKNKISINNGTIDELDSLPSIGKITANKIISYREINGNFKCLEEIKNVSGIGGTTFEKIKDYIIL